ncbi:MAG: ABC transporter ATP-binding protein [Propionicimonas sp.]|uniref:ABC transporter ATP-binding protein n=1 Tax=Propionicimonas sp. TaxID=1955623 RepID=UPI002B21EDCE|nr:ABC transporter ATP-binding protein [Propionicimonas sp.]MEA4944369.1 ABC transporter ATP-binding protein [Propionicimonas sp.]
MTSAPDLETRTATSVALAKVVKEFGSTRVLHELDLQIEAGEFVSLLGPSGCGKTTALRLIAGLEQLTSGQILMNGQDVTGVPTNKRDIGMVFQAYSLFPHLTVLQNTTFGLEMRKTPAAEAKRLAGESLELVGLADLAGRYPHELSGGQQQRVALARALVTSPKVLLLDEPLSALDAQVRVQLRMEIRRIQQELGITTIFVTHDQEEALAVSDRIAVMSGGRIEQIGAPEELYLTPATPFVASFVGMSSLVPAVVAAGEATLWGMRVPVIGEVADGSYEAFVRPEHVRLAAVGEPSVAVTVETSTFLGSIRRTMLRTADGPLLTMQHSADQHLERGDTAQVTILPVPVVVRPA